MENQQINRHRDHSVYTYKYVEKEFIMEAVNRINAIIVSHYTVFNFNAI